MALRDQTGVHVQWHSIHRQDAPLDSGRLHNNAEKLINMVIILLQVGTNVIGLRNLMTGCIQSVRTKALVEFVVKNVRQTQLAQV